jgi:hypothetical protein
MKLEHCPRQSGEGVDVVALWRNFRKAKARKVRSDDPVAIRESRDEVAILKR